jgi:cytochrome P450
MEITAPDPGLIVPYEGVDVSDPLLYQHCQHAMWRTMRDKAPVSRHRMPSGDGFWGFSRYAECERIVKDHRVFGSEDGTILASVGVGDSAGGRTITLMDPPKHGDIRRPTMKALSHSVVRRRAPGIRRRVRELVEPCLEGGVHDFAKLMRRLPMVVIGDLMGIPDRYWDTIAYYTTASIAPDDPEYACGATTRETLRRAHHELFTCFTEIIDAKRAEPGEDLITALLTLETDGAPLEDFRVALNCYSFLLGANSTTAHVASHTLLALAQRPHLWDAALADPRSTELLIEEGARWTSPTNHLVRRVREDTEFAGVTLAKGDWVCAWVASANRDESVFADPYSFDPGRSPNPHLSFGAGPHYCIGAPSSRMALGALFQEIGTALAGAEPAGEPSHLHSNWINGLTSMPMTFHPRAERSSR